MSSEFDTELLISEVEKRSQIWDASQEDYKNREIRLKARQEVGTNVIPGFATLNEVDQKKCVEKAHKRWKTARDAYFKSRNKINQKKSGSAVTKTPKYIYHDQLNFLDRIREGPTESNFGSESVPLDADCNNDLIAETKQDEPPEELADDVRPNLNTQYTFKRKMPTKNSFEDDLLILLKDSKQKEEDDDRAFLASLLLSLKTLNMDQKLLFRSQVLQQLMSIKQTNQPNINVQPPYPSASFHYPSTSFNYAPPSMNQQHPNQFMQFQQDPSVPTQVSTPNPSPSLSILSKSSWETL